MSPAAVVAVLGSAAAVEAWLLYQIALHPAGGGGDPRHALGYLLGWAAVPFICLALAILVATALRRPILRQRPSLLLFAIVGPLTAFLAFSQYGHATPGFLFVGFVLQCASVVWVIGSISHAPNPSLNTVVPHAGLRPGSGPPVSLFR